MEKWSGNNTVVNGSDQKVWIGKSDTMNLEMAGERAKKMLERGIQVF